MEQLRRLLARLNLKQKIVIGAAAVAVMSGLAFLLYAQRERDFLVLYSNLSAEDAGSIVQRLKESGADYRLAGNGSMIKVRSGHLADLRLQMASAGVPKTGRIGFELFDRTNLGGTEFAEQVNYHRALEGELERTVAAIDEVEQARVHITPPKDSVFEDQRRPAKASVLLKLKQDKNGQERKLSPQNVKAVTHLVASAVEGLTPEHVNVLDVRGNLLTRPMMADGEMLNEALFAYKRALEKDLLQKVTSTLDPLVGPDHFRAAVSVDCDLSSGEQSEEAFDPSRSVMTASQRLEETASATQPTGVPGAPSNLPRPTSRPGASGQGVNRRSENINFQTSRTTRRTQLPQGNVRRISVSVLVDHRVTTVGNGPEMRRVAEPPPPEYLKSTRDILAGVVGLRPERGDQLIVEAIPFESTRALVAPPVLAVPGGSPMSVPAPAVPIHERIRAWFQWVANEVKNKNWVVIGFVVGAPLLLVLTVAALLLLRRRMKRRTETVTLAAHSGEPALTGAGLDTQALPSGQPSLDTKFEQQLAAQMAAKEKRVREQEGEILASLTASTRLPSASTKKAEVLARHLAEEARKNPESMARIIRSLITDGEVIL